ncbi:hypothetical protein BB558_003046 [Smittium angustum]|uniref:DUF4246 domain-containing protein n=1 Tax=Smittium angustum TaxID=133377 RepID=A0A2U1J746_SMIAN|nr:hypothetical protein BB558_003046 [Smittium angustum]
MLSTLKIYILFSALLFLSNAQPTSNELLNSQMPINVFGENLRLLTQKTNSAVRNNAVQVMGSQNLVKQLSRAFLQVQDQASQVETNAQQNNNPSNTSNEKTPSSSTSISSTASTPVQNLLHPDQLLFKNQELQPHFEEKAINYEISKTPCYSDIFTGSLVPGAVDCTYIDDNCIPEELLNELKQNVAKLEDVTEHENDWHPVSDNQVLDLVPKWDSVIGKGEIEFVISPKKQPEYCLKEHQ